MIELMFVMMLFRPINGPSLPVPAEQLPAEFLAEPMSDPGPKPGEVWCYRTYKMKVVPQGVLCHDTNGPCWIRVSCTSPPPTAARLFEEGAE